MYLPHTSVRMDDACYELTECSLFFGSSYWVKIFSDPYFLGPPGPSQGGPYPRPPLGGSRPDPPGLKKNPGSLMYPHL